MGLLDTLKGLFGGGGAVGSSAANATGSASAPAGATTEKVEGVADTSPRVTGGEGESGGEPDGGE